MDNTFLWKYLERKFELDSYQPQIAQERYNPIKFRRQNHIFKISQLNRIIVPNPKLELPTGAILHLLDNLNHPEEYLDTPRIEENIFIQNESTRKFMLHIKNFNLDGPINIQDKFVYRMAGLPNNLLKFRAKHGQIRNITNIETIPTVMSLLTIVNHNPLFRAQFFGARREYRKFNAIFASVLNTAVTISQTIDKTQYIQLPWGENVFTQQLFIRSRSVLNVGSVKYPADTQYLLMMHILNYLHTEGKTSYFSLIPEDSLKKIVFILQAHDKYMFFNLLDLKTLNENNRAYFKILNSLNSLAVLGKVNGEVSESIKEEVTQSLHEKDIDETPLPKELKESVSKIYDIPDEEDVPPVPSPDTTELDSLLNKDIDTKFAEQIQKANTTITTYGSKSLTNTKSKSYTSIPVAPKSAPKVPSRFTPVVDSKTGKKTIVVSNKKNTTTEKILTPNIESEPDVYSTAYMQLQDQQANAFIDERLDLTPKQQARLRKLATRYKDLTIDGTTLESILSDTTNINVETDILGSESIGMIPDKSALRSSIDNFDKMYMKNMFNKHLAGVITSFNKCGVYLTNLDKQEEHTEMNSVAHYNLKFEDINGKTSTVKFSIPIPNHEGKLLIDGTYQILKKQRVNLPIIKISDYEISLASNQNKTRVERNTAKAHSYFAYMDNFITHKSMIKVTYGHSVVNLPISYEYVSLGERFKMLSWSTSSLGDVVLYFDYATRMEFAGITDNELLASLEAEYGTLVGTLNNHIYLFVDTENTLRAVDKKDGEIEWYYDSLFDLMYTARKPEEKLKPLTEWIKIKILDAYLPVIFLLGYKYGLINTLEYMGVKYVITDRNKNIISTGTGSDMVYDGRSVVATEAIDETKKYKPKLNDIPLKFADRIIWINRYPLSHSLIAAGMDQYDLTNYNLDQFEDKDVYYGLLMDEGMSINYLRGIDSFFDLFIDNITHSALLMMKEPTNVRDLLIRCAVLLSTTDHKQASARENHRLRGMEQMVAVVYNEMARQFAAYQAKRGKTNTFSINPDAVYLRIIQNASMVPSESVNPLQDMKEAAYLTYSGFGGRTSESFVVEDRKFSKDDIGIISEGTVDNQKVGMNAQLSLDPGIRNTLGIMEPAKVNEIQPANALSIHALTFPFSIHDDSKRINFISTQSSHMLPTAEVGKSRVRTGYERIIAHRVGKTFAGVAEKDGRITNIDTKLGILEVTYSDSTRELFPVGDQYTEFQGFHVTQELVAQVELGQKVKKGDILTYNKGYFNPDRETKQVDFSIGVPATITLMEIGNTQEDAITMSRSLGNRLGIKPTNTRIVVLPRRSIIHKSVKIGDHVSHTDPLVIFEEEAIEGMDIFGDMSADTLDMMGDLNRKTPKAKFAGKVVKIEAYYGCKIADMHPTLATIVKEAIAGKVKKNKLSKGTISSVDFPEPTIIPEGSKYKGVTFDGETVCLIFYIQEQVPNDKGDKIVVMNQLKATTADIYEENIRTESGIPIDAIFSANGMASRVVASPQLYGITARIVERIEQDVVNIYFGKK